MSPFRQYLLETSLAVSHAVVVVAIVASCGKSDTPPASPALSGGGEPPPEGHPAIIGDPTPPRLFDLAGNPRTFPGPAGALAQ